MNAPVPQSEDTQAEVMAAFQAGDEHAVMEILVTQYGDDIYRYCRRLVGNTVDGDDLSQTVFVQVFQCLKDLPRVRSIHAWLIGIARNRCVDHLRSTRRKARVVEQDELHGLVVAQRTERAGDDDPRVTQALDNCLDRLDARSRTALVLRFRDGLSYNEIGQLMSDTAGALRIRVVRGLSSLRRCLKKKGVQP